MANAAGWWARHRRPRSYCVYYGRGPLAGLEAFELAILEPAGWTGAELRALAQRGGTRVAYLSALEVTEETYGLAHLTRADILLREGRPWFKREWGTWVADPRSDRWRHYVVTRAAALVAAGWHGVFLDTIGDVEDDAMREHAAWLLPAAAELVLAVRRAVGGAVLIQNHGLLLLLPFVAAQLDAICWESPPLSGVGRDGWADLAFQRVMTAALQHDLLVLLLGLAPEHAPAPVQALAALAAECGALAYTAPDDYHLGVRLPGGGVERPPVPER